MKKFRYKDIAYRNALHRFLRNEQGSFAVPAALSGLVMLFAIGAVIDLHQMHTKKMQMQDLIDNATLSAALAFHADSEINEDSEIEPYQKVGEKAFKFDNRFDPLDINSLTFNVSNDGTEVTGSVRLNHALFFGGVLGDSSKNISAKSVVSVAPPEAQLGNTCIIVLDQNASPGLNLNSGATIDAPDCDISIHSTRNPALGVNSNVDLNVNKVCVAGNRIRNNGGPLSNVETECEVMDNPFVGQFPQPDLSCDFNHGNFNDANVILSPGVYCGWFNFNNSNAQVTFNPGTYVIRNGGWNVNGGTWGAQGVSFYFADNSRIQFNSSVRAAITAPTTGDYRGVAFLEPDGQQTSDFTFNDTRGFDISGLVYLPSRNVTFNSGADFTIRDTSFIVNRLMINQAIVAMDTTTILSEVEGASGGEASGGSVGTPYLSE